MIKFWYITAVRNAKIYKCNLIKVYRMYFLVV